MNNDRTLRKRARSASSSSSSSSSPSSSSVVSLIPAPKYHRPSSTTSPSDNPFICTLPPTCNQPATITSYATLSELERHQQCFHRWICRTPIRVRPSETGDGEVPESFMSVTREGKMGWRECGKAFPEGRLLDLVRRLRPVITWRIIELTLELGLKADEWR